MLSKLRAILQLIRFPNLLIIAATQYAMRYLVMRPLLPGEGFEMQFGEWNFFFLVLATVFIAAGGYIINDYFDTRTDLVNKPSRVVVGLRISRRKAIRWHAILSAAGICLGIYLGYESCLPSFMLVERLNVKIPYVSLVFILITGLLWFYSTNYKKQFLVGNLLVALFTGMVPLLVVIFEMPELNRVYGADMQRIGFNMNYMAAWVGAFSFCAFLTTLIRELIKDAEDFEGDRAFGMRTMPIVLGSRWTKVVVISIILFTMLAIRYVLVRYILFSVHPADIWSMLYFIWLLLVPLAWLGVSVALCSSRKDYRRASSFIKLIMLSGILYSFMVFFHEQIHNL